MTSCIISLKRMQIQLELSSILEDALNGWRKIKKLKFIYVKCSQISALGFRSLHVHNWNIENALLHLPPTLFIIHILQHSHIYAHHFIRH